MPSALDGSRRWATAEVATLTGTVAVTATFAVLVWQRRWITDDGLIVVRVARQIVAGNGPVYNVFERTEPHTSTLWTWLIAGVGAATRIDFARLAVALGGLLAVLGVLVAMDATRRWQRARGGAGPLVPGGALIVLGVFPFWDHATAGLETGLALFWIAASWWLLVALPAISERRGQPLVTAVLGLGPLVRPDLALVSAVFLIAAWRITRPSWRRTLLLGGAAIALPLAYTIFRAGYYGTLVPLPALAKSAGRAEWERGARFVGRFASTYTLWLPLGLLALTAGVAIARRKLTARDQLWIATPTIGGLLLAGYVARVGGDFMHGRVLLAPTFLLLLPALLLPLRWLTAPALVVLGGWALVTAITVRTLPGFSWYSDWDERATYVGFTREANPTRGEAYARASVVTASYAAAVREGQPPSLFWEDGDASVPLRADLGVPVVVAARRLGSAGVIVPLDGIAADLLGLAHPIGARITRTHPGRTGHEKQLPWAWILADFADPALAAQPFDPAATPEAIRAARHAMTCGTLRELLESVRAPLTPARFWANLTGAFARSRLVIPADPVEAERELCR